MTGVIVGVGESVWAAKPPKHSPHPLQRAQLSFRVKRGIYKYNVLLRTLVILSETRNLLLERFIKNIPGGILFLLDNKDFYSTEKE